MDRRETSVRESGLGFSAPSDAVLKTLIRPLQKNQSEAPPQTEASAQTEALSEAEMLAELEVSAVLSDLQQAVHNNQRAVQTALEKQTMRPVEPLTQVFVMTATEIKIFKDSSMVGEFLEIPPETQCKLFMPVVDNCVKIHTLLSEEKPTVVHGWCNMNNEETCLFHSFSIA